MVSRDHGNDSEHEQDAMAMHDFTMVHARTPEKQYSNYILSIVIYNIATGMPLRSGGKYTKLILTVA